MRKALFLWSAVVVVAMLAGCGSGEGYISTPQALRAFRRAGFSNLTVISNKKVTQHFDRTFPPTELPRALRGKPLDEDTISTRAKGWPFVALFAVRLPSSEDAKKAYQNNNPAALRSEVAQMRQYLPQGFSLNKLMLARVCNILLSSFNAKRDPALTARFDRAVRLLRKEC